MVPSPWVFEDQGLWGYGTGTKEIVLPPGDTIVTDTIDIRARAGVVIRGHGRMQSRLIWQGPADKPVFTVGACRRATIQDLTLQFHTPALAGIVVTNAGITNTMMSTENTFKNLDFDVERSSGKLKWGIVVDAYAYGGNGANSEHHVIEGCSIKGCTKAGIAILSSQAHRCVIRGNTVTACGIAFFLDQASQVVEDNAGSHCGTVLFAGQCFAGPLQFERNNFENCNRFAILQPSSRLEQYLIRNNRCDGMFPQPITDASTGAYKDYSTVLGGIVDFRGNVLNSYAPHQPVSVLAQRDLSRNEFVGNFFGSNAPPKIRTQWVTASPWGDWRGNVSWVNGVTTTIAEINANGSPVETVPVNTPWPTADEYPDNAALIAEFRQATQVQS